jgi:dienelactone hydrolase
MLDHAERITLEVAPAYERGASVAAELRIPDAKPARLAAVVILNSSPGFDGRSAFYAQALNDAGIATLEVDMAQGRGLPASPHQHLPHAFGSLRHLAAHPRIDAGRIGVMGFSWGGSVALLAAFRGKEAGGRAFAASLPLYPVCWKHHATLVGAKQAYRGLDPALYKSEGKTPVHIVVGEKDDYDGADACERFVAALPAPVRKRFEVTVLPGATFAWDSRFSSAVYEAAARQGRGGTVTVNADAESAARSRDLAVAYFRRTLRTD